MDETVSAMCFLADTHCIFYGDTLLTTVHPSQDNEQLLMKELDLTAL